MGIYHGWFVGWIEAGPSQLTDILVVVFCFNDGAVSKEKRRSSHIHQSPVGQETIVFDYIPVEDCTRSF